MPQLMERHKPADRLCRVPSSTTVEPAREPSDGCSGCFPCFKRSPANGGNPHRDLIGPLGILAVSKEQSVFELSLGEPQFLIPFQLDNLRGRLLGHLHHLLVRQQLIRDNRILWSLHVLHCLCHDLLEHGFAKSLMAIPIRGARYKGGRTSSQFGIRKLGNHLEKYRGPFVDIVNRHPIHCFNRHPLLLTWIHQLVLVLHHLHYLHQPGRGRLGVLLLRLM
mmetsp:Transcript_69/g.148  ORF Transcript_69/g.148 Transcript_69/m.148 type:complete len:221 (-) Transcript_69:1646-2308(-)